MKILYGFQLCLGRGLDGVKLFIRWQFGKHYKEVWIMLKRNPNFSFGDPEKTPKMADPALLTKLPKITQIQPEDMMRGIQEPVKFVEPEDM